nr:hypothetical protein [Tanacetum cinerariifolium]
MDSNKPNTFNTYDPNNPDTTNTYDHYDVYFQGSAPKRTRTYIPREREDAEHRLIDDNFGDDETLPKYLKEYFRRRQRYDAVGRKSIGPILKCTSPIRQLVYDTEPDAFD